MPHNDDVTLLQLSNAATFIQQHTAIIDKAGFLNDEVLQKAVLYELLTVGEAVKRLSKTFQQQHTTIPWSAIARTRDRVIHGYDHVDLDIIWGIVTVDIPELLNYLRPLLPSAES